MAGPTGEFPRGMLNEDDEGALVIEIGIENDTVVVRFGTEVRWIGMPPDMAIEFALNIIKRANQLKKGVKQ